MELPTGRNSDSNSSSSDEDDETVAGTHAITTDATAAVTQPVGATSRATKSAKSARKKQELASVRAKLKTTPIAAGGLKKPYRFRPGTVAKREIHMYQMGSKADKDLMQKAPLERLIRDIMTDYVADGRLQGKATQALYAGTQDMLVGLMKEADILATMCNAKTIGQKHLRKAAYTVLPRIIIPPPVRIVKVKKGSGGAKARASHAVK